MNTEAMPMDALDETPIDTPANDAPIEQPSQGRDEHGRFAPKGDEQPARGKPDPEAAARRERQERDEARREAAEAKAERDALRKRFEDMAAIAKGDDPAEQQPSDPNQVVLQKLDAIDKRFADQDQQRANEEAWTQIRSFADQDEQRFAQQQPDFHNAVQHYIQSRINELAAFGHDQGAIDAALQQEAQQLLINCAQAGRSPAETLFKMAQARGFAGGVPMQQQDNVVTIPQRPAGGRSLGHTGAPAGGGITSQQIQNMSEEDYNEFRNTPEGRRAIKRMMGG